MHVTINHDDLVPLIGRPDPLIIEIGCNDGIDTLEMLKRFPDARIWCFEPDPRPRERWRRNLAGWRGVSLHPYAIGATEGTIQFNQSSGDGRMQPEGWDYSGSIHQPKEHLRRHPWCKFKSQIEVPITSLDTFYAHQIYSGGGPIVDLIWADTQGAEADMLEGAKRVLTCTRFLYTEFSDHEMYEGQPNLKRILELLPGWTLLRRYSEDVLLQNGAFE